MPTERSLFFVVMAAIFLALNAIGFHESYFLRVLGGDSGFPGVMHVHVAFGFALFVIFLFQSVLAYRRRFAMHRKIGVIAAVVSLLLLVAGFGMILEVANDYVQSPTEDQRVPMLIKASAVWVSLFVEVSFGVFMGLAILLRHNAAWHKRLVFLALLGISSPALARMGQFPVLGLSPAAFTLSSLLLLVSALAVYDWLSSRRVHVVTLAGGTVQVVGLGLCAAVIPYTRTGQAVIVMLS